MYTDVYTYIYMCQPLTYIFTFVHGGASPLASTGVSKGEGATYMYVYTYMYRYTHIHMNTFIIYSYK